MDLRSWVDKEERMPKQIGYVVGSLRKDSWNRKLATALIRLGPPDFNFKELRIGDLPLYDQDEDRSQAPEVQRLKTELRGVDAVIFVTPEYNRSVPGVLKNALDHASRPYGQSAWTGKPAGVIGASIGAVGTAVAQLHLRTILAYLDMPTLGQPEAYVQVKDGFFDDAGNIASPESRKFLHGWMDKYCAWVKRLTG
jgi:chromate reductase